MAHDGASETPTPSRVDGEPTSAQLLTAASDTNTRAESRRTEDEAVTLPIPSSGLLTSPTQVAGHNVTPTWFGGLSPMAESHFSLAPLLGRGATNSAVSPNGRAAICTSTDGAVRLSGSPRPWPTPPHAVREFGHMPSRACSSGGNPTPSRRRSSCGNLTLAGMVLPETTVEEESEGPAAEPACSACSDHSATFKGQAQTHGDEEAEQEGESEGHQAAPAASSDWQQLDDFGPIAAAATDDECTDEVSCGPAESSPAVDCVDNAEDEEESHEAVEEPEGDSSSLTHNVSAVIDGFGAVVDDHGGDADAAGEALGVGNCGADFTAAGGGDSEEGEGPRWLTAEECAVSDAITQLQAVVSGLSEPYQRYIRERALELTRIIDENLQRQGLEPAAAPGGAPGMATPSKKAATAAAALVLAVAASGTHWPYSTPSGGEAVSGVAGGDAGSWPHANPGGEECGADCVDAGTGADGGARWLFRSPDLVGQGSVASGGQTQALSYGAAATSGSCTLCFGSVLGNSQARPADSAEQTSGAVSARGGGSASQHGPSSRPTPRSRSYSSYYAQQQSHRRANAGLRANVAAGGAGEPVSAVSSACSSNPYHLIGHPTAGALAPLDASARPSAGRRGPPRPPPRGLGCGLGQPRKMPSEGSRPEPNVDVHNLPYMVAPYLEPAMSARDHMTEALPPRRSRVSGAQPDQQQPLDQEDSLIGSENPSQQQQLLQQDTVGLRRNAGRPMAGAGAGSAVILRPGSAAGGGGNAKNGGPIGRGGIRPAQATPAGYQPPWQRPPPSARGNGSASERQRADIGTELEPKNRKGASRVLSARGTGAAAGLPVQPPTAANAAGQRRGAAARRPPTQPRTASEYEDDVSGASSAREPATSDAGSSYHQLLRKSGGPRSSLVSTGRRAAALTGTAAAAAGALLPPHAQHTRPSARCSSYPIAMSSELPASSAKGLGDTLASDRTGGGGCNAAVTAVEHDQTPRTARGGLCGEDNADDDMAAFPGAWDSVLQSELPYHLVQAFPPMPRDDAGALLEQQNPLDWQPLHTALTLDELQALAQHPADSEAGSGLGMSSSTAAATGGGNNLLRGQQHGNARGGTSAGGAGRVFASAFAAGGTYGGLPFDANGDDEPATAFAIVSRRGTRDVADELAGQSSMAATSSMGDLSSLLPAPAWRQGRNAGGESTGSAGGRAAASTFAVATAAGAGARAAAAQLPLEPTTSATSGCSTQVWDNNGGSAAAADQFSRARENGASFAGLGGVARERDPTFGGALEVPERGGSGGGSAAAQLRSVLASMAQAGNAQGRRWGQLDADRLVVPDKEQIRAGSPVRPRYAGNSDCHTSPAAPESHRPHHHQQQPRRREAAPQRDAGLPRGSTKAAKGAGGAAKGKGSGAKRSSANGTLGGTGRAASSRSRSTPHARAAKAIRAARVPPSSRPPAPAPMPPLTDPLLLLQRPATPVAPSSPPPPQQSQTPVQLQQQQPQAPGAAGARRWTDDDDGDRTHGSGGESDGSPSTPTRRRVHVHSPEDMPLSAAARQSSFQPRLASATAATVEATTFDACGGSTVPPPTALPGGLGLGVATLPAGLDPPIPSPAPAAWGTYGGGSPAAAYNKLRNGAAAVSPRLRGVAYAALPSHRFAAGRAYTTTSIHTDGSTTVTVTSPGLSRGAWHHDCTPNILSPPRNYDRPWATPSRKNIADASGADLESSGYPRSARLGSPGRRGTGQGDLDGSFLNSPSSRRGSMTARPSLARGGSPRLQRQGSAAQRSVDMLRACLAEAKGADAADGDLGAALSGNSARGHPSAPSTIPEEADSLNATPAGVLSAALGLPAPGSAAAAVLGGGPVAASAPVSREPSGSDREGPRPGTPTEAAARVANSYASLMLQRHPNAAVKAAVAAAQPLPAVASSAGAVAPAAAAGSASGGSVDMSGVVPAVVAAPVHLEASGSRASGSAVLQASAPDMKAEGVQTDALDATMDSAYTSMNRTARRSSDGSRSRSSPSGPMTSRTDGGRGGYNMSGGRGGRPPTGAFRPSGSLRAAPAGTGGAQLALLHQAAWPGLRDPRVVDALSTLEAGIAVLDPAPPPPPSSLGTHDATDASGASTSGSSAPNGCFGLFSARSMAPAPKPPVVVPVQESVGQRPVLLRVHVADGAVELVLLRPRRPSAAAAGAAQPPAANATAATAAGEQRVRVAALSGLHPPLISALSPAGGAGTSMGLEDDVADPSSRWVQLVAMDGGLMRLSACSPADHARLVLGLNAGLLAAMGAIGEETPLAVVPLSRGLGGAP